MPKRKNEEITEENIEELEELEEKFNSKTREISENFTSVEEMLNENLEIEEKITSTELIKFYFNALESTNILLEKNKITEKSLEKTTKILNSVQESIEKLEETTKIHKEQNEDKKTIEAYKESWDNMNLFIKSMINKLNAVTIKPNDSLNKEKEKLLNTKKETPISTYIIVFSIIILAFTLLIKKIFF